MTWCWMRRTISLLVIFSTMLALRLERYYFKVALSKFRIQNRSAILQSNHSGTAVTEPITTRCGVESGELRMDMVFVSSQEIEMLPLSQGVDKKCLGPSFRIKYRLSPEIEYHLVFENKNSPPSHFSVLTSPKCFVPKQCSCLPWFLFRKFFSRYVFSNKNHGLNENIGLL